MPGTVAVVGVVHVPPRVPEQWGETAGGEATDPPSVETEGAVAVVTLAVMVATPLRPTAAMEGMPLMGCRQARPDRVEAAARSLGWLGAAPVAVVLGAPQVRAPRALEAHRATLSLAPVVVGAIRHGAGGGSC